MIIAHKSTFKMEKDQISVARVQKNQNS